MHLTPIIMKCMAHKVCNIHINEFSVTSMSRGLKTDALISGSKLFSANLMIELHQIIKAREKANT